MVKFVFSISQFCGETIRFKENKLFQVFSQVFGLFALPVLDNCTHCVENIDFSRKHGPRTDGRILNDIAILFVSLSLFLSLSLSLIVS